MSISNTRPHVRLRFILLAVLATVITALLLASGGSGPLAVEAASAHGSCSNSMYGPSKTAAGRIKGSNAYNCTGHHASTTGCAQIVFDTGAAFTPVDEPSCKTTASSDGSGRAYVSAACAGTGFYRVMGVGEAGNTSGQVPHTASDVTGGTWIQCTPDDLATTGGVFEDLEALLASVL